MKIVNLDGAHLNPGDLSWDEIEALGELETYPDTNVEQIVERAQGADIVITNKVPFDKKTIEQLPDLKCICVSATGYNIVDIDAANEREIVVCNAPNYSTDAVAQHVFASIFAIYNKIESYSAEVAGGVWTAKNAWSYTNEPIQNLVGKTMGILGFGTIGQRVGELAQAFGMKVIAHHKHPKRDAKVGIGFVDLKTLFESSDILTLHVPLNDTTKHIVNASNLGLMQKDAILINTGRGPLIDEEALASTLRKNRIRATALDVLTNEPPRGDNPLLQLDNCLITPHIAWAGVSARQNLMAILSDNIKHFLQGKPINQVNG